MYFFDKVAINDNSDNDQRNQHEVKYARVQPLSGFFTELFGCFGADGTLCEQ